MAEAALVAVGLAIIVATIFLTAVNYGALPQRIPLHFWIDGTVNNWGPRPAAWLLPGVQLLLAFTYGQMLVRGVPATALIIGDCVLVLMWRAQVLIIATAKSGKTKAELGGFWLFLLFTLAVALLVVFFARP